MRKKLWIVAVVTAMALSGLCAFTAQAAQWAEGRSAAQPYANVPEVDLEQTMGYIMRSPSDRLPAEGYCDRLMLYLPREDLALGQGTLSLYEGEGQLAREVSFEDAEAVSLRAMEEDELDALLWGSGSCVEILLPVSLDLGESYYVLMDEGCIQTQGGIPSPAITNPEAWVIELGGDYGVGGARVEQTEDDEAEMLRFQLVLGGEAERAVLFSEDDSVTFEETEYDASGEIEGTVNGDAPNWGVVFMNGEGEPFDMVYGAE